MYLKVVTDIKEIEQDFCSRVCYFKKKQDNCVCSYFVRNKNKFLKMLEALTNKGVALAIPKDEDLED